MPIHGTTPASIVTAHFHKVAVSSTWHIPHQARGVRPLIRPACHHAKMQLCCTAAGKEQQGSAKKNRPGKAEKGDKLDDMVANYKAKYFGGQIQAGPGQTALKQANKQPAAGISRWFE